MNGAFLSKNSLFQHEIKKTRQQKREIQFNVPPFLFFYLDYFLTLVFTL